MATDQCDVLHCHLIATARLELAAVTIDRCIAEGATPPQGYHGVTCAQGLAAERDWLALMTGALRWTACRAWFLQQLRLAVPPAAAGGMGRGSGHLLYRRRIQADDAAGPGDSQLERRALPVPG